jgi:hypothetical protein
MSEAESTANNKNTCSAAAVSTSMPPITATKKMLGAAVSTTADMRLQTTTIDA